MFVYMPDFKDPQEFDSGEENQSKQEEIFLKKESIAEALALGLLSHDNPSPRNRYTSLEQLILFEFNAIENPDVRDDLTEIKREIISISKGIDSFDYDIFDKEDVDEKALNIKIAKYVARGYITDDNISDTVSLTSLEQTIHFKYGSLSLEELKVIKREIVAEQINLRGGSVISKDEYSKDQYRDARQY